MARKGVISGIFFFSWSESRSIFYLKPVLSSGDLLLLNQTKKNGILTKFWPPLQGSVSTIPPINHITFQLYGLPTIPSVNRRSVNPTIYQRNSCQPYHLATIPFVNLSHTICQPFPYHLSTFSIPFVNLFHTICQPFPYHFSTLLFFHNLEGG